VFYSLYPARLAGDSACITPLEYARCEGIPVSRFGERRICFHISTLRHIFQENKQAAKEKSLEHFPMIEAAEGRAKKHLLWIPGEVRE